MGLEAASPPRQPLKPGAEAPCSVLVLAITLAVALSLLLILRPAAVAGAGGATGPLQQRPRRLGADASELAAAHALLAAWPEDKPKACILVLARNSDLEGVLSSVSELERRFNRQFEYPYW